MNEKLYQLLDLCLQIQQAGEGVNGHPYISVELNNCGNDVTVYIMNNGFEREAVYDGLYHMKRNGKSEQRYAKCEDHLKELIEKNNIKNVSEKQCLSGALCDVDSCNYHNGIDRCMCKELYISDAETGDARCMQAEFDSEIIC